MYLSKIDIANIKSIRKLTWKPKTDDLSGWHVVLGNNGSGKSTFLKAMALALIGKNSMHSLRQDWNDWLRKGTKKGTVKLGFSPREKTNTNLNTPKPWPETEITFVGGGTTTPVDFVVESSMTFPSHEGKVIESNQVFSAAYGPFRRFSGGDPESDSLFAKMPVLARHLSVFDERVALSHCLKWLKELKFRSLEGDREGILLKHLIRFVNKSGLLPSGACLKEVTSRAVVFRDPWDSEINVEELSDGFRSILSMTFELIRQMAGAFGPENLFNPNEPTKIKVNGVVLIDEIDAHLHPTWQKRIGSWFCEHFPNVQFIVTTHSPLICQSAEKGSIFLLPRAGSSDEKAQMVTGDQLKRLLFGNVLDAYGTEAFGSEGATTQSASAREKRKRLAFLNNKELASGLSDKESREQDELRGTLPSVSSSLR